MSDLRTVTFCLPSSAARRDVRRHRCPLHSGTTRATDAASARPLASFAPAASPSRPSRWSHGGGRSARRDRRSRARRWCRAGLPVEARPALAVVPRPETRRSCQRRRAARVLHTSAIARATSAWTSSSPSFREAAIFRRLLRSERKRLCHSSSATTRLRLARSHAATACRMSSETGVPRCAPSRLRARTCSSGR